MPAVLPPIPQPEKPVEGMPTLRHAFANTNGVRLHYVTGGAGPAVVLLHRYPYTWAVWKPVLRSSSMRASTTAS